MTHKRYRIKSTPRFVTFLVVCLLTAAYIFNMFAGDNKATGLSKVTYHPVMVESGDTLWNIAQETYENDSYTDIRDTIDEICSINNIQASQLKAGQVIMIPDTVL